MSTHNSLSSVIDYKAIQQEINRQKYGNTKNKVNTKKNMTFKDFMQTSAGGTALSKGLGLIGGILGGL